MSSEGFSRKRKRQEWKDLPAFMDASASVSATTFGARRLPEIKALWNAQPLTSLSATLEYKSGGGKTSSRHLRRRTTSHKPRKRHRYPRGKVDSNHQGEAEKRKCRRARRKPALLREKHEAWQQAISDPSEKCSVFWLPTHFWHAKRFHMHENFFGWKVPLVHTNRGARAALRMANEGHTLIQDVTWRMQPIIIGSPDLKKLIGCFQRICPNVLSSDAPGAPNAILSGNCFGEGMLHEVDAFPSGGVGPAMWWISGKPLDSPPRAVERKEMWWLHVFVHPAIRDIVSKILSKILNDDSSIEGPRGLQEGLACFQLRGRNATTCVKRALGPIPCGDTDDATSCILNWDTVSSPDGFPADIFPLSIISAQVSPQMERLLESPSQNITSTNELCSIDSYKERLQRWDPTTMPAVSPSVGEGKIILVAQCQNNPLLSQNAAVCGWDIFCHPSDASSIFQALSVKGDARAIGLVEESLARLDCEPSLPVFPWDYPDTKDGQSYWSGESNDWHLFRQSLEQGWGRVHVGRAKQKGTSDNYFSSRSISWSHISTLPEHASSSGSAAVVVRGHFGQPFVEALAGCGHLPHCQSQKGQKQRRPRRPVRSSTVSRSLQRLSKHEALLHQNTCENLLQSLSLPALLRCHVKLEGKGTIVSGGTIVASMQDTEEQEGHIEYLLGTIVAGSFSRSRGLVHGVGFVGAARLLHVLSSNHGRLSCVVVNQPDGTMQTELKVSVKACNRGCKVRNATISLLL